MDKTLHIIDAWTVKPEDSRTSLWITIVLVGVNDVLVNQLARVSKYKIPIGVRMLFVHIIARNDRLCALKNRKKQQ